MNKVRTLLLGATVLSVSAGAHAQPATEITEINVSIRRPMAESVAAALEIQRNSDSLVSVLSRPEHRLRCGPSARRRH